MYFAEQAGNRAAFLLRFEFAGAAAAAELQQVEAGFQTLVRREAAAVDSLIGAVNRSLGLGRRLQARVTLDEATPPQRTFRFEQVCAAGLVTCGSGRCAARCDGLVECDDGADERDCPAPEVSDSCAANEFDLFAAWAHAVVHESVPFSPSRKYAAGMIALRPDRDGTIQGYDGFEQAQREFGEWILDHHLPPPGTSTQSVEGGYMANAWVRLKHPDYDELRRIMDRIGDLVQVRAG